MAKSRLFSSATLKLTLSYLGIMAAICLMFSAAIYHFAGDELQHSLYRQSQRISNEFPGFDFDPALRPARDFNEGSHHILLNLLYFNIAVLIMAGFASYGLARWTLRPIQESHEQQERFTADVSHELRTPLTSLKTTSEVALLDSAASKMSLKKALESNLEDATKLELLVNNLLRLTRLEATELQQHFTSVNLSAVADHAVSGLRDAAAAKSIAIVNTVPKQITALGDQPSLEQLLTILIDNAVKYSAPGGSVELSAEKVDNKAIITLVDHGAGIAKADLLHVFERFYRADSARSGGEHAGFGLGLSIAKHIADVHNGRLQLTSQPGVGTTAHLELPAAKA